MSRIDHLNNYPATTLRPMNISTRPEPEGVIYVETSMPPPSAPVQYGTQQNPNDIPGVLRRNQACLACRRRKLKCDATRPHCSTCVRSFKHLCRTSPKSNPVLSCEYDDYPNHGNSEERDYDGSVGSHEAEADTEENKKKKRKAGGDVRRKRKDEEEDETERLRKKIEALETKLAEKSDGPIYHQDNSMDSNRSRPDVHKFQDIPAPSPTAFLEMLSTAASAQAAESINVPVFRNGASESAMIGGVPSWNSPQDGRDIGQHSSGLTPYLSYSESQQNVGPNDSTERQATRTSTGSSASRHSDQQPMKQAASGVHPDSSPTAYAILSPNNVFNFSPGPSGPNTSSTGPVNSNWPPPPDHHGQIQPSTFIEGPWRAVETLDTVFAASANKDPAVDHSASSAGAYSQPIDLDMDAGLLPVDEAMQQQLLLDLFWPGWPINLPEPHIAIELVEAFFDLVPNLSRLLHRARFLARLALPPTHSNFPHPALIHAVCSCAAAWCEPRVYQGSSKCESSASFGAGLSGEEAQNKKNRSFGLKQAAYGKEAVQDGLNTGNRLFDVVRAMIILSRVFIDDTRMLECWAYCGLVARMILPLGLNVRSAELSLKSVMLPPAADALEREERRITVWMAFYHDTVASAASGWGTSMLLDELSVPLPVSEKDFSLGSEDTEANPQDVDSPDLWTRHPVVDPFVMTLKACLILNRVNRFTRKWKNRRLRDDDDLEGMQRSEFRELANAIACLQMSFPPSLRNPGKLNSKKRLDIDLISAIILPNAAAICLYEPFADITDPSDPAARRILGAAQGIVATVQQLASVTDHRAQNFTAVMHSSASISMVTAARTSLLFYRHALNINDSVTAETHRMDIEVIRMALEQFGQRMKIGQHHAQLLEYFLDRATHPTVEKIAAHYPEHPRPGAPELHDNADLGVCVINALNIKRGYWRLPPGLRYSADISPFGSTPESLNYMSSTAGHGFASSASSGSHNQASLQLVDSNSPSRAYAGLGNGSETKAFEPWVPLDAAARSKSYEIGSALDGHNGVLPLASDERTDRPQEARSMNRMYDGFQQGGQKDIFLSYRR